MTTATNALERRLQAPPLDATETQITRAPVSFNRFTILAEKRRPYAQSSRQSAAPTAMTLKSRAAQEVIDLMAFQAED